MTPTDPEHPTGDLTDARGVRVGAGPVRRVASLVPSLTETVFGLGAGSRLVARTIYCVEPRDGVHEVPACGGTKNPDIAAVLANAPDLILACLEENKPEHLAELEAAGVPVFAVMPRRLDDVASLLTDFGTLLDSQAHAGRALADLTTARLAAGEWRRTLGAARRAVCLVWKKPWMAAGGDNHITAMMGDVGLTNVLSHREGYPEITLEELAELEPELVLLPDEPFPFTHRDAWSMAATGVVPTGDRAVLLDGKTLCWYGTRTARALRGLIKLLEPRLAL